MHQSIISYIEKHVGPKMAALGTAALALFAQGQAGEGAKPFTEIIVDIFSSGNLLEMLPAPLIAFITFYVRSARADSDIIDSWVVNRNLGTDGEENPDYEQEDSVSKLRSY